MPNNQRGPVGEPSHAEPLDGSSYVRFEDTMRGPRSLVRERLQVYLPIIAPLRGGSNGASSALDIGSGRGEWLELLNDAGWHARGVDSNPAMVEFCRGLGLDALHANGFDYLAGLESNSVDVVTAFHVVEHLTFAQLVAFLRACLRVLKPAGILIMETPNPQNLIVGCSEFYVDPTHERPLPPKLLNYAARDTGFRHSRVLYVNGERNDQVEIPQLRDIFVGTAFDYAVVAQKTGDPAQMAGREITGPGCATWGDDASLEEKLGLFDRKLMELHTKTRELEALQHSSVWKFLIRLEGQVQRLRGMLHGRRRPQ